MAGGVLMVVMMVLVVPVGVMLVGAVWSALFGQVTADDVAERHPPVV